MNLNWPESVVNDELDQMYNSKVQGQRACGTWLYLGLGNPLS